MKRLFIVVLLFITVFAVVFLYFLIIKKPKSLPPAPPSQVMWNSIVPGKTTFADLVAKMGQPDTQKSAGVFLYPTNNKYWKTEVSVSNNSISFVKEKLFSPSERSLVKLTSGLKSAPVVFYGPDFASNIYLYIYANEGVAYLASKNSDLVFEAWYFPPNPIDVVRTYSELTGYSTGSPRRPDR